MGKMKWTYFSAQIKCYTFPKFIDIYRTDKIYIWNIVSYVQEISLIFWLYII